MRLSINPLLRPTSWYWLLLTQALGLGLSPVGAYSSGNLLTWMQASNFGLQVLQYALNDTESTAADERACVAEVQVLLTAAGAQALPALRVLDAWGKFPQGLLYGHFSDLGNYESCLSGSYQSVGSGPKYCLTHIQFKSLLLEAAGSEALTLNIGTCVPSSCSAAQLNRWLHSHLQSMFGEPASPAEVRGVLVQEQSCSVSQAAPLGGLDWFAVSIFAILGTVVLLATLLDYRKASGKLIGAFSLRRNVPQLFDTSTAPSPRVIPCLHGIRCLTILWIIFGHGYMFLLLAPNINSYEIVVWAQTPFSMLLQSGSTSVDTFFLLSGLLLVLTTLREMERNQGRLHVPLMYLHRLVRLTPVLALAVLFFMTLFPRLDNGPLWQQFTSSSELCKDTWWATLLYVQNYAAAGRMCLGHSWYLAVDMQLYVLSPIVLIALHKWGKRAVGGIVVLILLLFGCVFSIIMLNELQVFDRRGNLGADSPQMRLIYYTTHARATPWLIGLLFGHFLHTQGGRKARLPRWMTPLMWLLCFGLLASVLFAVFPYTQPGAVAISPVAGAFYLCSSRIAWPLALCWLIWACQNGVAPGIDSLLGWSLWQPLSKLSYCLYIWHLLVETVNVARTKSSLHFSDYDAFLRFWSDFGVTLLVSLVMYLFVEMPVVRIELELLRKFRKPKIDPAAAVDAPPVPPVTSISRQNLVDP
ncbi:nose resistant to fluoxetine protein 6 [Drosophila bipectinata]|uniref:nose resistant to fluoxetine protein 6 n=1 Tax=Drosophila bipectinata TaxID=42026 RepID=UPI001C8A3389|nr:nose resistant to fluoxetine protein 6 [Drosophila bipectinata]